MSFTLSTNDVYNSMIFQISLTYPFTQMSFTIQMTFQMLHFSKSYYPDTIVYVFKTIQSINWKICIRLITHSLLILLVLLVTMLATYLKQHTFK